MKKNLPKMPEEMPKKRGKIEYRSNTNPLNPEEDDVEMYEKLADENIKMVKEIQKGYSSENEISGKVQKKIAKKVAVWISAGIAGSTGVFVGLGETGNLPGEVQEWYDESAVQIRQMFGVEVGSEELSRLVAESESKELSGLEIEGLTHVFRNNRWEYIDPNDGTVAGFWNEKEGRYEHVADVLRGEWTGLFVSQPLEEVKDELKDDEEWTKENWENGKIKIPITFDITKGGIIEEIKAQGNIIRFSKPTIAIGIRNLSSETVIFSPFPFENTSLSFSWTTDDARFSINKDLISLTFNFKNTSQCLILDNGFPDNPYNAPEYVGKGRPVFLGYPILEVGDNDVLSKITTAIVNPFLKENYQVLALSSQEGEGPINFSFENLLRDDKGRFVFIAPEQAEIEKIRTATKEEIANNNQKVEEKELEEKIETSSLIEKSETAPVIEGLRFDKETGFYFTEDNTKAGEFKNGFLGLNAKTIESLKATGLAFGIPLPFNPLDAENIKMVENKIVGVNYLLFRLSSKVTIYSPVKGTVSKIRGGMIVNVETMERRNYEGLYFTLGNGRELLINSEKFDSLVKESGAVEVGEKLGEVSKDVFIEARFDNILTIDNNLVFILPNE